MVEPVDVAVDKNGRIFIGKIKYENGEPVSSDVVDCTSQGFNLNGLDAFSLISAGYTCHMYDGKGLPMYQDNAEGTNKDVRVAHIQPVYEGESSPVVDIQSGATIGFRYINFGESGAKTATLKGDIPMAPPEILEHIPPKPESAYFLLVLSPKPLTLRGALPHYLSLKKELAYSSS